MPKPSILIVDDEQDIRELIRFNLEREGYDVLGTGTGEEGLEIAQSEQEDSQDK